MLSLTISHPADAGQRLDRFVRKYLSNAPLGGIFKMLRTGKIKVGGKKKDQTYKLELGDEVTFYLTDSEIKGFTQNEKGNSIYFLSSGDTKDLLQETQKILLDIIYEDEYLMIVNKPAGINVHAGDHKTTESNIIDQVQDYLQGQYDSLTFRPALVHRIDRDTSGCLLIAKDKGALDILLNKLQSHDIEKIYHTIVVGVPDKQQDTIRARLLRIDNAKNEAKVRVDEAGQSAVTHYKILMNQNNPKTLAGNFHSKASFLCSLLECRIETGRTHQIRVHMAYIGHPVLADRAYGDKSINSYVRRSLGITRQLLHAYSLTFVHPKTNKKLTIVAPYPSDFVRILEL
ncbi:RluA family pseudouridine synthase [Candidatus Gracilibacteria bacterium]|nr:RluA family pseudouridine synthase [Candidatus Gracilibacteria bacterium]